MIGLTQNMWKKFVLPLIFLFSFSACKSKMDIPLEFPTPPLPEPAKAAPKLEPKHDAELERQFAKIAEQANGRVGAAAIVLETGEAAFFNADEHYPMQSVYKLPITMAVMEEVRQGRHSLDEKIGVTKDDMVRSGFSSRMRDDQPDGGEFTITELINLALIESDGTASDVLLRLVGGPGLVQSYLSQIGIRGMKVANTENEIGRDWKLQYDNWATPSASVELLRWLDKDANGWRPPNLDQKLEGSQILLEWMMMSVPGRRRIKGELPLLGPFKVVAHKTGTGGTHDDGVDTATNDIGIIYTPKRKIAIAVYVSDSPANEKTREGVIAKIAKAVWDKWVEK